MSGFSPRAALALVGSGAVLIAALLWLVGAGIGTRALNDGGPHAAGHGLNGYAAFAALLRADGYATPLVRGRAGIAAPGVLVLTPDFDAKGADIAAAIALHRRYGPVLLIHPKWRVAPVPQDIAAHRGWVRLAGVGTFDWPEFLPDIALRTDRLAPAQAVAHWSAGGIALPMPYPAVVQSGIASGRGADTLQPWVVDGAGHDLLADVDANGPGGEPGLHPLVAVFEPDLFDNAGMARVESAALVEAVAARLSAGGPKTIAFDLTLDGLGRHANLATLAFTPPFVGLTLCLTAAAVAAGWRGFVRLGRPVLRTREIAFGKTTLVANSAALLRRAGRLHLAAAPYAALLRARAAATAGIAPGAASDAAIDRALAARGRKAEFAAAADRLRAVTRRTGEAALVSAAQDLYAAERSLER